MKKATAIFLLVVICLAAGFGAYYIVSTILGTPDAANLPIVNQPPTNPEPADLPPQPEVIIPWDESGSATTVLNYLNSNTQYANSIDKLFVKTENSSSCVPIPEGKIAIANWFEGFKGTSNSPAKTIILSVKFKENQYGWCGGVNGYRSTIFILKPKENAGYELSYLADGGMSNMEKFIFAKDINGDGTTELAFASSDCGAHTCGTTITVLKNKGGQWEKILDAEMATAAYSLKDQNNDGFEEIILKGGTVLSVGAGIQRQRTEIYGYNNTKGQYELLSKDYDVEDDVYFLVMDAYYALQKKDYDKALSLAQKALDHPDWTGSMRDYYDDNNNYSREEQATLKNHILGYAAIETMLAYLGQPNHDQKKAAQVLSLIKSKYSQNEDYYYRASSKLLQQYSANSDLLKSCQEMEKLILTFGDKANLFPWVGYNQENIELKDFCPLEN